jgi:hypothetical protein
LRISACYITFASSALAPDRMQMFAKVWVQADVHMAVQERASYLSAIKARGKAATIGIIASVPSRTYRRDVQITLSQDPDTRKLPLARIYPGDRKLLLAHLSPRGKNHALTSYLPWCSPPWAGLRAPVGEGAGMEGRER